MAVEGSTEVSITASEAASTIGRATGSELVAAFRQVAKSTGQAKLDMDTEVVP